MTACASPRLRNRWSSAVALVRAGLVLAAGIAARDSCLHAADPVVFRTGAGRFEVAAIDGTAAGSVNAMADEGWRILAGPLGLPEAFSSSILVRLVPAEGWRERAPFRVFVEPGGLVSLRIRWDGAPDNWTIRRGLVQVLLMRQAVAYHGVVADLTAPLWLEIGCVGWWHSRTEPANLDALKHDTANVLPPTLAELLGWQRGAPEPTAMQIAAVWLLSFLQSEGAAAEWTGLRRRLLAGEAPLTALAAAYPNRFDNESQRELWWQTGWHHLRRASTTPVLAAAESRIALEALGRFVVLDETGREMVAPLRELLVHARELWLDLELQRRTAELNRLVPSLHPFYRNAGLSLAHALAERGAAPRREEVCRAFDADWRDARELEAASAAALDRLERSRGGRSPAFR